MAAETPFGANLFGQVRDDVLGPRSVRTENLKDGAVTLAKLDAATLASLVPSAAWNSYVPLLSSSGTQPNITYTVQRGGYTQIGRLVVGWARLIMNVVTTPGTGVYYLSLPVAASTAMLTDNITVGSGWIFDNSGVDLKVVSALILPDSTHVEFFFNGTGGVNYQVNATIPWTWANGDQFDIIFMYESAVAPAGAYVPPASTSPQQLQFGSFVGTTTAAGEITITYPAAFNISPTSILMTNGDRNQGLFFCSLKGGSVTTTQFVAKLETDTGAVVATTVVRINWMAMV